MKLPQGSSIMLTLFSRLPVVPSPSPFYISAIHHPPCPSRWTCGWWGRPQGYGRSLRCRRQASEWGGHWTAEGDSPGWHRPAETRRKSTLSSWHRDEDEMSTAPVLLCKDFFLALFLSVFVSEQQALFHIWKIIKSVRIKPLRQQYHGNKRSCLQQKGKRCTPNLFRFVNIKMTQAW